MEAIQQPAYVIQEFFCDSLGISQRSSIKLSCHLLEYRFADFDIAELPHVHIGEHARVRMRVCLHVCMYVCIYIYICVCVCIYC